MSLKDFPVKYRNNMHKLHNDYLNVLKPDGKRVTLSYAVQFVNALPVKSQMYFMNQQESHPLPSLTPIKTVSNEPNELMTPEYSPMEIKCPNAP
jgi:hypothetical protein